MTDDAARQISCEGLAALEAELRELETEGRRAIAERIRTAREWGDLDELEVLCRRGVVDPWVGRVRAGGPT
jgi:hypothetical protein